MKKGAITENFLYNMSSKEYDKIHSKQWEKAVINPSWEVKGQYRAFWGTPIFLMHYDWMTGRDLLLLSILIPLCWISVNFFHQQ